MPAVESRKQIISHDDTSRAKLMMPPSDFITASRPACSKPSVAVVSGTRQTTTSLMRSGATSPSSFENVSTLESRLTDRLHPATLKRASLTSQQCQASLSTASWRRDHRLHQASPGHVRQHIPLIRRSPFRPPSPPCPESDPQCADEPARRPPHRSRSRFRRGREHPPPGT
jgi:hypothetical protein